MKEKGIAIVVCVITVAVVIYAVVFASSRTKRKRNERQIVVAQQLQEEQRIQLLHEEKQAKLRARRYAEREVRNKRLRREAALYPAPASREKQLDVIYANMLRDGALYSMNVEFNEVRINPVSWMGLTLKEKQGLVMNFSFYFNLKGSTKRVTVRSSLNDTKMATYGSWGGLKILF